MLSCYQCQQLAFLVHGLCLTCAPELHRENEDELFAVGQATEAYESRTKQAVGENWAAFTDSPEYAALLEYVVLVWVKKGLPL